MTNIDSSHKALSNEINLWDYTLIHNLCIVWKTRNLTACHQSENMTYLHEIKAFFFDYLNLRIWRTNERYCNIIWSKLRPCFIIQNFTIGNIAYYIKQAHVFNMKKVSTRKPYFGKFGPCKLLWVVDASSDLKLIILLIIVCTNCTIESSCKELSLE